MNGTKVYTTGIIRSSKYGGRIVETYSNVDPAGTYQAGSAGAYPRTYYPPVPDSADCPVVVSYGNERQSRRFQKQGCSTGFTGSFVDYVVPQNTFSSTSVSAANTLAIADIDANGQAYANMSVNGGVCLVNDLVSVFFVDIFDALADVCAYIDTPGIAESGMAIYRNTNNFLPVGTLQSEAYNAFGIASDNMTSSVTKRRFGFNIAKYIQKYPDASAIPTFTFKIRGRRVGTGGVINGNYQKKNPGQALKMTGAPGTYIPTVDPAGTPDVTNWSSHIASGGDGSIGTGVGSVFLTFVYTRATNSLAPPITV